MLDGRIKAFTLWCVTSSKTGDLLSRTLHDLPSIHLLPCIPFWVHGGCWSLYPVGLGREAGNTLDETPIHVRTTFNMDNLSPTVTLEEPVLLSTKSMFLGLWQEPGGNPTPFKKTRFTSQNGFCFSSWFDFPDFEKNFGDGNTVMGPLGAGVAGVWPLKSIQFNSIQFL